MPTKAAFPDRIGEFFDKAPSGFDYAVETGNQNYLAEDFFDFLRQRGLGFVLLDGCYLTRTAM